MSMRYLVLFLVLLSCAEANANTVYRYQDEKGRWHFTDRKPKRQHETLEVVQAAPKHQGPELRFHKTGDEQHLVAHNPLHAPVQFELLQKGKELANWVVEARSQMPVLVGGSPLREWLQGYEYRVRMGKPINGSDGKPLRPPVPGLGKFLITQGFGGHYSHAEEPNRFSVDIAMQVGESVHAARDGIVVFVKDDYHMGGANHYFLDKANRIEILHNDGTFGVYAHILLGSALVNEGERVKAGEPLAGAGSSGYSTGPHLHFGLRANNGEGIISLPFRFKQGHKVIEPQANQWLEMAE